MSLEIIPLNETRLDWHREGRCTLHDIQTGRNELQDTVTSDLEEFEDKRNVSSNGYVKKCAKQFYASQLVSDLSLPGHLTNGRASCGEWRIKICKHKDQHKSKKDQGKRVKFQCSNKGCVKCFDAVLKREALNMTARMVTSQVLKNNSKVYRGTHKKISISHVIVDPDRSDYELAKTPEGRNMLKEKVILCLKKVGYFGSTTISHPYRFSKPDLETIRFSPHYHNLSLGWMEHDKVEEIYRYENKPILDSYSKTKKHNVWLNNTNGWRVISVARKDKNGNPLENSGKVYTEKACYNLAYYLLSHAGVIVKDPKKRSSEHTVTYSGFCHNSKFKVKDVLKYSEDGLTNLRKIIQGRMKKRFKSRTYHLGKCTVSHVTVSGDIRESKLVNHEAPNDYEGLLKFVSSYMKPKAKCTHTDGSERNHVLTQSDSLSNKKEEEREPLEFLQIRFDYEFLPLTQSTYFNIVLNPDISDLCPEDSHKLSVFVPPENWSNQDRDSFKILFKSMKKDEIVMIDDICGLVPLSMETISPAGMQYFNKKGELEFDDNIYAKPSCLRELPPQISNNVRNTHNIQTVKYRFKIQNGRSMGYEGRSYNAEQFNEELDEALGKSKLVVALRIMKTASSSHRLSDY